MTAIKTVSGMRLDLNGPRKSSQKSVLVDGRLSSKYKMENLRWLIWVKSFPHIMTSGFLLGKRPFCYELILSL